MTTPEEPAARDTPEVDPAALAGLQALFAELPREDMPADVTDRVMAALQRAHEPLPGQPPTVPASATEPASATSIEEYRRRRRTRRILTSAAALLIVVGGIIGLIQAVSSSSTSGSSASSSGAAAGSAHPNLTAPFGSAPHKGQMDTLSAPDFTAADLPGAAAALAANPGVDAASVSDVAECVAVGFQSGAKPIAAQQGRYDNRSALLLLYQDPTDPNRVNAFLVALPCAASGTTTLWHRTVTR